ncbi:hypothetical protein C1Y41_04090 [Pantoea sp. ICBG 1758]|uniref:M91 family zinc metallopeptidase n=1 Tax=Pantoea sp. ICBG 1758 TaxID=2071682 RepID=UPI000CE55FC3|nr:M91 family zinc metallopeptidase [Pantoea sp. ICBG 1758]PPC63831.1 hypothetical protein C1Y41_04090 [Pantoea sp. ICBG 1758]
MPSRLATECHALYLSTNSIESLDEIDNLVSIIRHTQAGNSLLKEIEWYSRNGKNVKITTDSWGASHTRPLLTEFQAQKHGLRALSYDATSLNKARELAVKKGKFKAEGTYAEVTFNRIRGQTGNSLGYSLYDRYDPADNLEPAANLAGELIHAMRIIKGTYTNDGTSEGIFDESTRSIGAFKHENKKITENKIRQELGLQARSYYPLSSNDAFGQDAGSQFRPGPSISGR